MNKFLIGLLLVAAGAGIYFLLQKKDPPVAQSLDKELILGKWTDSPLDDSTKKITSFEFQKENLLIKTGNDPTETDTLFYEWNKEDQITWKRNKDDSVVNVVQIVQLTKDTLKVIDADSSSMTFFRMK